MKINFKKFGLYFFFLIVFSVVVYSINPGHPLNEIQGYFPSDTDLSVSIPKFQSAIGDCTGGKLMTGINPDGTVICDDLKPVWGAPSSITARNAAGNGNMGGYKGMATYCTGTGEHVCDAEELTIYSQINGVVGKSGWYNTGTKAYAANYNGYNDCRGWTNFANTNYGDYWNNNKPSFSPCSVDNNVLCCKY